MLQVQLLDLLDYFLLTHLVNQFGYQQGPLDQLQQLELARRLGLQRLPVQFLD